MFTELSYVKDQLRRASREVWAECAKASRVHFRTISRIAYNETTPGGATLGKIATFFRTREKRSNGHRRIA